MRKVCELKNKISGISEYPLFESRGGNEGPAQMQQQDKVPVSREFTSGSRNIIIAWKMASLGEAG
jgi:hypothetical protein